MDHPLRRQVQRIARRARLLLLVRGAAWFLFVAVLAAVAAGSLDYTLRTQDVGVRVLISLAVASSIVWAFVYFLLPVLKYRSDEVTTARWIERCRPEWRDELSSAIAFLRAPQDDYAAGSLKLRAAHIEEVTARLDEHPFAGCLRWNYSLRPVALASLVAMLLVSLCIADAAAAQLAARRILSPWLVLPWPRRNQLALINPMHKLAAGQDFEAIVIDRKGHLPDSVTIHYWYEGTSHKAVESVAMNYAGGRMVHRLINVTRPFRYRVTGGDDDKMPWQQLTVVQPPNIQRMTAVIHPPAYSGWKTYESIGPFQALQNSRIELTLTFSEPIQAAVLRMEPATVAASSTILTCDVSEDGMQVRSATGEQAWVLNQSGKYWFEITARDGLTLPTRAWDVQALLDEAPIVRLTHAAAGSVIGTRSRLPISVSADDDLAVQSMAVHVLQGDGTDAENATTLKTITLWTGPASLDAGTATPLGPGDKRNVEGIVSCDSLGLEPGQTIQLVASASDYKPQEGRSAPVQLRVVSNSELEDRMVQLQSRLLATVDRALNSQRDARGRTRSLELQFEENSSLLPRQADALKGIDLHQRQIHELLVATPDSALHQAQVILSELQFNQLALPAVEQQIAAMIASLQSLEANELPVVQQTLLETMQELSSNLERGQGVTQPLQASLRHAALAQDNLLARLEELVADLAKWEGFRRFAGEVRQIARDQQRLLEDSSAVAADTLGRELDQLTGQQRAELRRLADQQMSLVRRTDDLVTRMTAAHREAQTDGPSIAAALSAALAVTDERTITVNMRASAQAAEDNRLAESTARQREVLEDLADLLAALTGATSNSAAQPNAAQAAGEQVAQLLSEQQQIDGDREGLAASSDANAAERQQLAERQQQLGEKTARLAQQLASQRSPAAVSLDNAASAMDQSAGNLRQGDLDAAQSEANSARQALDEAANLLADQAAAQQQSAWAQRKAELLQRLNEALPKQRSIHQGTVELEQLRTQQSLFSPEQRTQVLSLGDQQQQLAELVGDLSRGTQQSVIDQFVDQLTDDLREATARLLQVDTGAETQARQQRAIRRMEQILEALGREPDALANTSSGDADVEEGTPEANAQRATVSVEELELLQILQADLAARAADLLEKRGSQPAGEWQREQQELAAEQEQLQRMLERLFSNSSDEDA